MAELPCFQALRWFLKSYPKLVSVQAPACLFLRLDINEICHQDHPRMLISNFSAAVSSWFPEIKTSKFEVWNGEQVPYHYKNCEFIAPRYSHGSKGVTSASQCRFEFCFLFIKEIAVITKIHDFFLRKHLKLLGGSSYREIGFQDDLRWNHRLQLSYIKLTREDITCSAKSFESDTIQAVSISFLLTLLPMGLMEVLCVLFQNWNFLLDLPSCFDEERWLCLTAPSFFFKTI